MLMVLGRSRLAPAAPHWRATVILSTLLALSVPLSLTVRAQQPQPETPQQPATPAPTSDATPAPAQNTATPAPAQTSAPSPDATQAPAQPAPPEATQAPASAPAATPAINEDELKQLLVGKQVYLREGYLGDSLNFDEHGHIVSHSPQGSYTLSIIQIDHVRITKHKVELEGIRYGLHFNEQLAYEDSSTAYDKVRITPKKKLVKITIDREMVIKPKQKKESAKEKAREARLSVPAASPAASATAPSAQPAAPETAAAAQLSAPGAPDQPAQSATTPAAASPAASTDSSELSEADQLKASIAATPEAERPADPNSVTTTTSQAHANKLLRDALDAIFAPGLDKRMMAAMPDCWKLYYQAVADKADYRPSDPSILRQNTVDQKALLLTSFEPDSNDFAQSAGVAGMALYHTIIGADGKPGEIAVARPIGFGLDENAVAAIRKAKFSPAVKDGQPVPVMLDLVVQFRIFSKRTAVTSTPDPDEKTKPTTPALPGPYSVQHPN